MVAMAGMFLAGSAVFHVVRASARSSSSPSPCSARVTVLPAMLSKLGDKRREGPRAVSSAACATATTASRACGAAILDRVLRRPVVSRRSPAGICSSLLAIPALGMHTINPGVAGLPRSLAGHADLRPHPGRVPRRPAAGGGRGQGRRRHARPRSRPGSRSCRRGDRALASSAEPVTVHGHQPGQDRRGRRDPDARRRHRRQRSERALADAARRRRPAARSGASPASRPT